ncbi:GNAT family protein [Deinococcus sp. YIM 134068]|uniref:GNAT family N-acetyltransferase n=1 Tax=Deinococcus lichenicola TaxID=3118910 RepID=UPI002F948BB6
MSRVVLRPLISADAPALTAYRNDPEVARYQGWPLPYPLAAAEALIHTMDGRTPGQDGWTQLALADADTGALLGDLAVRGAGQQAEVGITLAPHAQGYGLAAEGLNLLIAHLFGALALHRVYASVDPRNRRAAALLARAGFRHEGTTLESYLHRGGWADDAIHGLLAREWRARHPQENLVS